MNYSFSDLEGILEHLKDRLNIAVIYAGNKHDADAVVHVTQNTRPWKSYEVVANDIADAIRANGFKNVFVVAENIHLLDTLRKHNIHIVWLNSAGVQGFNPMAHAPSLLEMAGIPYIGHNPLTTTVLDNKHYFKSQCLSYGIPTGRFLVWDSTRGKLNPRINSRFKAIFAGYYGPFIVKPVSGRASLGVSLATYDELTEKVDDLYRQTHNSVLVEEYFSGPEYCVSVSGPIVYRDGALIDLGKPFVFSEIKRVLEANEMIFTSMDIRPINSDRFCILDAEDEQQHIIVDKLHDIAHDVYLDFNLRTLARIDIRADIYGNLYVLEANPKPDLKAFDKRSISLVAAGLDAQHIGYADYIYSLIANRIHYLFQNKSENIAHITALI